MKLTKYEIEYRKRAMRRCACGQPLDINTTKDMCDACIEKFNASTDESDAQQLAEWTMQQARERGIEINPAQGSTCTMYHLENWQAVYCNKPAIANAAKLTPENIWRMHDLCEECLSKF